MNIARTIIRDAYLYIWACSLLLLFPPCLCAQVVGTEERVSDGIRFNVQLLGNPSFETWVNDGEPGQWKVSRKRVSKSDNAVEGTFATEIRLLPGDKTAGIDQILSVGSITEGTIVQASIRCYSAQPEVLDFALFLVDSADQYHRIGAVQKHPGGGWATLSIKETLPYLSDLDSLNFRVKLRAGAIESVIVDDASLRLLPPKPVPSYSAEWQAVNLSTASLSRPKAPFRTYYSNDTTQLEYCISPFRKSGEPFLIEHLEASIDETADIGIDVHLLQPGTGWVPWWKSKIYPADEHYRWWKSYYNLPLCGLADYMMNGGDIVDVFVKRCREKKITPFVSLRMNDHHGVEFAGLTPEEMTKKYNELSDFPWISQLFSRDFADHPEYRLDPESTVRTDRIWNWKLKEVRDYKLAMIAEICDNYDIDGFELDFMRYPVYFRPNETTSEERVSIMTEFIEDVRALLDSSAKPGQRRWLMARVPSQLGVYEPMGLDLTRVVEAGVDILNVSSYFYSSQDTDLAAIRASVPPWTSVIYEMTHSASIGQKLLDNYDGYQFRRTTDEAFFTTAHLAYSQGADGISTFNLVYYRKHQGEFAEIKGPYTEPPFHIYNVLRDPVRLAQLPQYYFLGTVNRISATRRQLPRSISRGQRQQFVLKVAPTAAGWRDQGKLRIECKVPLTSEEFTARLNGVLLVSTDDVSAPYPHPYTEGPIEAARFRAWRVPVKALKQGENHLELQFVRGEGRIQISYLDLAISPVAPLISMPKVGAPH